MNGYDQCSCIQFNLIAFPVELEVGQHSLFGYGSRNARLPDEGLDRLPPDNVPLDLAESHIDHSPQLIALLRLDRDIPLLVLLADGPVIAIIAHTVHLLEGELLLLILIRDHTHNDIIVLDQDYLDVEVELPILWESLGVVELISGPVKLLHLVGGHLKLAVVLRVLINFKDDLLPELLNLLPLFQLIPEVILLHWGIVLSMPRLLMVVIELLALLTQNVLNLILQLPNLIRKLQVLRFFLQNLLGQGIHCCVVLLQQLILVYHCLTEQAEFHFLVGKLLFEVFDPPQKLHLPDKLNLLKREKKLLHPADYVDYYHNRMIFHPEMFGRVGGDEEVKFLEIFEEHPEFYWQFFIGIDAFIFLQQFSILKFQGNGLALISHDDAAIVGEVKGHLVIEHLLQLYYEQKLSAQNLIALFKFEIFVYYIWQYNTGHHIDLTTVETVEKLIAESKEGSLK